MNRPGPSFNFDGYMAMTPVVAAKVRSSGVLSSNSASIVFKNNAPTKYLPFKDDAMQALEAAEHAKESPGNNDWMLLQINFTEAQLAQLFVSNRICRIEMSSETGIAKYGFRVWPAVATDADAGLDLADYQHFWFAAHKSLGVEYVPWMEGLPHASERRCGDWILIDAAAVRWPHDEGMGDQL